jgi:hypothetical protein
MLAVAGADPIAAALWQAEFGRYRPLIERIVEQTERRVFQGETVAASEKIVSLFEPHTDIIVKGGREVAGMFRAALTTVRKGVDLTDCPWSANDRCLRIGAVNPNTRGVNARRWLRIA